MTPPEVAKMLRISLPTIYRLMRRRTLPFVRVGGQVRFLRGDVTAFLSGRRVSSSDDWK